jgi:predicted Zn-dependent protease
VYDLGSVLATETERVFDVIGEMFSLEVNRSLVADPFAAYQVEPGKIDPFLVAKRYLQRDRSRSMLLVLTSYDLKPEGMNYTFGATYGDLVSIVSTCRIGNDSTLTGVTSLHELFHQLGMVASNAPQHDDRCGMKGHCKNGDCMMRAVNNLNELQAVSDNWQRGIRLCRQCRGA